jgi:pimeloyl-ACP methyl ester carboxylesterase
LTDIQIPFGLSLLRFEHEGLPTMTRLLGGEAIAYVRLGQGDSVYSANVGTDDYKLDDEASLPDGKVRVPGWSQTIGAEATEFSDFFLDRFEVTNRKYKGFVDAGGYSRREFWIHPFVVDGRELSFEEAMSRFVDKTGRPGPSTWEAGDYPDGQDDYPVVGVSWYEAAAYARFVNEELPTVYHWRRAFAAGVLQWLIPASNIERDGLAPVGEFKGMSWPGTFDMVGNAREWTFSATGDQRFILGGGWNDPVFLPQNLTYAQSPMDRGATNGFRLMKSQDTAAVVARSREALPESVARDVYAEAPVPDEVISAYQRIFTYDRAPLNAAVEETLTERNWIRQRVSFDAAYGNERITLYMFLPTTGEAPYKTVVYWPGSNALSHNSIDEYPELHIDFVIKSGRALAFPVVDGTFERGDRGPQPDIATTAHRDLTIRRVKDMRRAIDYLETRTDVEFDTLAYYGLSWGGWHAPALLAVEPRLRSAVLYVAYIVPLTGSLWSSTQPGGRMLPEVDPVTYLRKVHIPVLMLNGEYDNLGPLETSVKPLFQLLGTDAADKRHVIEPGGHFVPRTILIRETLDWLDKYQGRPGS